MSVFLFVCQSLYIVCLFVCLCVCFSVCLFPFFSDNIHLCLHCFLRNVNYILCQYLSFSAEVSRSAICNRLSHWLSYYLSLFLSSSLFRVSIVLSSVLLHRWRIHKLRLRGVNGRERWEKEQMNSSKNETITIADTEAAITSFTNHQFPCNL